MSDELPIKKLILIYSRHNLFAKFDSSVEGSLYAKKVVPRHLSQTTLAHSYRELNGLKFKGKSQGLRTDSKSSRVQCSPWKRQDFTMPQRRWAARSYTSCQSKLHRSHFSSVMLSCCTYASSIWLLRLVRKVSTGMHQIPPMCCTSQSVRGDSQAGFMLHSVTAGKSISFLVSSCSWVTW